MKRNIVVIDEDKCNGCGECIPSCAEGALQIVNGKAKLIKDSFCDGLGACLGHCPQDAIHIEEKDVEAFDEAAVEMHQKAQQNKTKEHHDHLKVRCPGAQLASFPETEVLAEGKTQPSELRQWPIQLNLVPPQAPFLKDADLLLVADCVPIAYGGFHQDLLKGKTVVMGCPKFDDLQVYKDKLTCIFREGGIRSITVAIMEVPCCASLRRIAQEAYKESGASFDVNEVTIGIHGQKKK